MWKHTGKRIVTVGTSEWAYHMIDPPTDFRDGASCIRDPYLLIDTLSVYRKMSDIA